MKKFLFSVIVFVYLLFSFPHIANAITVPVSERYGFFRVLKVIDGDTFVVDVRGNRESVRLLGIDAPETMDPRRAVQCFGNAASDKMKSLLAGKFVRLIDDRTQGNRDKYHRLLRYAYLEDGTFVNAIMIQQGFAFSYQYYPTKYLDLFNRLEREARENNRGLWGACR